MLIPLPVDPTAGTRLCPAVAVGAPEDNVRDVAVAGPLSAPASSRLFAGTLISIPSASALADAELSAAVDSGVVVEAS